MLRALQIADNILDYSIQGLADLRRALRYVHECATFEARADDVFVVTYPRSGTTLMQMLLYQLYTPGAIKGTHISEFSPWFERSLANGFIDANRLNNMQSPRIFKSHLSYQFIPKGARYIYVHRDGKDVALSYYRFYCSHLAYKEDFDTFLKSFNSGRLQYASWYDHVSQWKTNKHKLQVLYVDYEDLVHQRKRVITQVADFLDVQLTAHQLRRAYERTALAYMKKHEAFFDHMTSLMLERGWKPQSFIRNGKTGTGNAQLTEKQRRIFAMQEKKLRRLRLKSVFLPAYLR